MPNLYFLYGNDEFAISRKLKDFDSDFTDPTSADMNTARLYARTMNDSDLNNAVNAMPFLAKRRLVYLANPSAKYNNAAARKKFFEYIEKAPETTRIVMYESVDPRDADKHWLVKWAEKNEKLIQTKAFMLPRLKDMTGWIVNETKSQGGQIEPRAAELLKDMVGVDTRQAGMVLAVFLLATAVLGRGSGLMAALLAAFLPPLFSRLLLAMYATIGGHLLDTLLIVAAVGAALRPEAGRRFLALCALAVASLLTYVSSLFTVSRFLAGLALLERRLTRRALALLLGGVATTVLLLYLPFTLVFLTEIGPRLLEPATPGQLSSPSSGRLEALARIPLFYGYLYPALALIGLIVIKKRAPPAAARVGLAYGLTFLGLLSLRAFGGGLFGDLKEITFVGPFIALTAGASLETLAARGRGLTGQEEGSQPWVCLTGQG